MDAQPALVLEDLEASPAGAADVEMDDELVDDLLQRRQVPSAAADPFDLLLGQAPGPQVVAGGPALGGVRVIAGRRLGPGLCRVIGPEPAADAVGVEAARVHPQNDLGRGMVKLPADDDLVATPW